jgi:hypothetical protein
MQRVLPKPIPGVCGWLAALLLLVSFPPGSGQEKKPDKKDAPKVLVAVPLGAAPGTTTKITIRGLKLDSATELRFAESKATAKIVSKGSVAVPDKNPDKVGNTQVVVEVTLPADVAGGPLSFTLVTLAGESPPHVLLVESAVPVVAEKEPNNSFRQAQPIQIPQAVDGLIHEPKDVDVFRFAGKAGQRLVCEVFAARHGSALDSLLTLYDADGQQLASNDDMAESTDSLLEVPLPKDGTYYLALMDAHDQGGPAHVYRLVIRSR